MIITCPDCATRYDVDDERFSPDGRSVRCTACGISWYVPAPQPIDDLIDDLVPLGRDDEADAAQESNATRSRLKVRMDELAARAAATSDDDAADGDDDLLFDNVSRDGESNRKDRDKGHSARPAFSDGADDDAEQDAIATRWKRGRHFLADDDEDDDERRPFFSLRSKKKKDRDEETPRRSIFSRFDRDDDDEENDQSAVPSPPRDDVRNEPRVNRENKDASIDACDSDDETPHFGRARAATKKTANSDRDGSDNSDEERAQFDDDFEDDVVEGPAAARIVDADWEDVDDDDDEGAQRARGFGRRIREERRRATAVARVEPIDPRFFDDEFFAALRVHPKELEKALRKARRRAEAREKNRMTPLRALGWSAWFGAIAATVFAVVVYREEIVKVAPGAADAYQVFGVETNPEGLAIENVRHRLAMSTAGPTIEITGAVRNVGEEPTAPPLLQAEALGPRGELLSRWTFTASEAEVLAGGAAPFITRAPAPDGVVEVALSFAPANPTRRN